MSSVRVSAAGETVVVPYELRPGPGTTGVAVGPPLPRYRGPAVIVEAGTVVEGVDVDQYLTIRAAGVRIRDSLIRGGTGANRITGLVDARRPECVDLVVERCTFRPQEPSSFINGAVLGHHYAARRCDVSRVVDGFGVYNTYGPEAAVTIEECWIHDLSYFAPDVASSRAETHNDGVQVQSGSGVSILRNRVDCFMATDVGAVPPQRARGNGILIQTNVPASPSTNWRVEGNWLSGGGNAAQVTLRAGTGVCRGNRFTRDGYSFGGGPPPSRYQIRLDRGLAAGIAGLDENYWADTGARLTEGRDTGIRMD